MLAGLVGCSGGGGGAWERDIGFVGDLGGAGGGISLE